MQTTLRPSIAVHVLWLLVLLLLASGCGSDRRAIAEVEPRPEPPAPVAKAEAPGCPAGEHKSAAPGATSADRFGGHAHPSSPPMTDLRWKMPEGWTQRPATSMRVANFAIGSGENEAQCYVTILPGPAGGVDANLNRWRRQMGANAATPEELAALPRIDCLGQEIALLGLSGNFKGMGSKQQEGAYLFGVVCPLKERTLFVKMMGPESVVAPERERFTALCASLSFDNESAAAP